MNCNEATMLVDPHADGELDGLREHALERHLRGCASCAATHHSVLVLRARFHAEVPYFRASPALRTRVGATLGAMRAAASPPLLHAPNRWRWLTGGAFAGCSATVLAWVLGAAILDWRASEDLAVEAVTTHVRATLGNHLIEVASSDQHTVKPWLSARLDYSPPVHDLATDGFTLVGGRLDTLKQQQVATLVYRYRLHTIDVFVRPESGHGSSAEPRALRGFNIVRARGSGWDWLAVSDVNANVLSSFIEQLTLGATAR